MAHIGSFETPDTRLARLRSALDSTAQSMGDTVTDAVDLEARRRAMEENLRRFREVEARQQPAFRPPSPFEGTFGERTSPFERIPEEARPTAEQRFERRGAPGVSPLEQQALRGEPTPDEGFDRNLQLEFLRQFAGRIRRGESEAEAASGAELAATSVVREPPPSFLDKALGVAGQVGGAFELATDPGALLGRTAESLQQPSPTGRPSPEELRRQALFATGVEATAPPSFTEIQELGATASRPLVTPALRGAAEAVEQVEKPLGVEGVVSDKLRSQLAEDIATEIFNPVNIALVAPFAMQGTAGLTGVRLAEQIASNLLLTGLEPGLVRGTLRGFAALASRGTAALKTIPKAVKETPAFQQALRGVREAPEAGARPLGGTFEEAKKSLVKFLDEEAELRKTGVTAEEISAGRKEQAAGVRAATEEALKAGVSGEEAATAGLRGAKAPEGLRQTIGELALPQKQKDALFDEATRLFTTEKLQEFEWIQSVVALKRAFSGRGLQPAQIDQIRSVYGVEVAEKLARRVKPASDQLEELRRLGKGAEEFAKPPRPEGEFRTVFVPPKAAPDIVGPTLAKRAPSLEESIGAAVDVAKPAKEVRGAQDIVGTGLERLGKKQLTKARGDVRNTLKRLQREAEKATQSAIRTAERSRQATLVGDFRAARDLMRESIQAATRSDDAVIQETELLLRESREALEGVSPRLAKRADDQITRLRLDMENKFANSEDLVAKAQLIAPETPELQTVITEWLRINEALLEGASSEMGGFLATTKAVVTGQLPDSFLTYLSQRRAILATILSRMMPDDPGLVGKITNELMESELRRRYGVDVPEQVRGLLAASKRAPYEEGLGWVETLVQRTKNTMFGIDIGVFMIQGNTALRTGGIPMAAGLVNRMLAAARLPHVALALADESLPKWSQLLLRGVHQGVGPSAVRAEQGTLFRYLPKLAGGALDTPLSAATEALNQLQFGIILTGMRNLTFEGNMVMAHLLRLNIRDAKVIATLADSANTITSFAWTALRAGRATAEKSLLISPSMTRAMVNRVLQVAKIISPKATATERMVAASMVSSWALFTLGVGKLVHDQVGVGEFIFDPTKPGFGLINLRNGRTINLFPQATLVKAIGKSFTAVKEGDPDLAKRAWISMAVGRSSIVGAAIGGLFDTGFQSGVGFRVGDLPLKSSLLNLAPMPPVLEEIITEGPSAFGIISELGGASQFETSPFTELRIAWENARGTRGIPDREFNPETDFAIAEQDSRLKSIVERSRSRGVAAGFPSAVAAQQRDELRTQLEGEFQLPTLAQKVPSDPLAGPAFVDAWFEVQDRMSGAVALDFLGEERNRETPLGQAVLAWQQISLQDPKFFDRETLRPDRQEYREAKDAAFAEIRQLDPDLAAALDLRTPSADIEIKKVEAEMLEALDVRRELFDRPKHVGVTPDEEREAADFRELVDQTRDRLAGSGLDPGSTTIQQYLAVAEDNGLPPKIAYLAFALRPNSEGETKLRDVRYTEFLFDNAELLSVFFPELYSARRFLPILSPEIRERVIEAAR